MVAGGIILDALGSSRFSSLSIIGLDVARRDEIMVGCFVIHCKLFFCPARQVS